MNKWKRFNPCFAPPALVCSAAGRLVWPRKWTLLPSFRGPLASATQFGDSSALIAHPPTDHCFTILPLSLAIVLVRHLAQDSGHPRMIVFARFCPALILIG